jgi:hypothetical protein
MIEVQDRNRVAMSQRERDVLKVMQPVLEGTRTQAEAARLLKLSTRQVRRIQRKLEGEGDTALVHGLRGQPSNHRHDPAFRKTVLSAYQKRYRDFGPTFACEKLADEGLELGVETLRRWLLESGLWERRRHRDPHRSRRPRRSCFGELVQMDASVHDWLEGRGETIVLITMIDDATGRLLARFYSEGTVKAHMDLLGRWLRKYGRLLALYTDRHSIFEPHEKGKPLADPDAQTQFGRALGELDIELIRAHSPQAKGRVERSFGTAQDRWVKELRLAKARSCEHANAVLERLLPEHNRRFAKPPRSPEDAHRRLGPSHRLESILSVQSLRVVSNDYVVRLDNQFYQLLPPVHSGQRGGRVVIEERLDGSMAIRFGTHYLKYQQLTAVDSGGGSAPEPPEFSAGAAGASGAKRQRGNSGESPRCAGTQPADGRSGRTPAEPYPPTRACADTPKPHTRPAQNHPWRKSFKTLK